MEILFQDENFVAVNKPSGLLVHRSRIDRLETRFALQEVRNLVGRQVYPVHRLDKPVSGVLLFALHADAARWMMRLFMAGQVEKEYLAVVRGYTDESGTIDYPLKEEPDAMTDADADRDKSAQAAVTDYVRMATVELPIAAGRHATSRYSLLRVHPRTGRKHQIRRHMKHIFHPIVGDTTHGDGKQNVIFRKHYACQRLLLHASRMTFVHPVDQRSLTIEAPLDPIFQGIVNGLVWLASPGGKPWVR